MYYARLIKEIWNKNGDYILMLSTNGLAIIFAFSAREMEMSEKEYYVSVELSPSPFLLYRYSVSFRCDSLSDFHFSLILNYSRTTFRMECYFYMAGSIPSKNCYVQ